MVTPSLRKRFAGASCGEATEQAPQDVQDAAAALGLPLGQPLLDRPGRGKNPATDGQQLRTVRTAKKKFQEQLAAEAGLHRTFVSLIERGERNVSQETIEKLAIALGVELTELMPRWGKSK